MEKAGPPGAHGVPLPMVEQAAVMDLVSAGTEVAAQWRADPQAAAALVREPAAGGELSVDEILDEAVDAAVLTGLPALYEARTAPDPSAAAEFCLDAVPRIALAAALASAGVG
ncbi:hypothetical protein AB0E83_16715 [Streptomyces sp. NPDC035033]|uniref:hypothetical protein n=1 Tax=Streptomyces sp. NPDC035033 TaxID=3155368 RepID=UPI0033F8F79C